MEMSDGISYQKAFRNAPNIMHLLNRMIDSTNAEKLKIVKQSIQTFSTPSTTQLNKN